MKGTRQGTEFLVNTQTDDDQIYSSVAALPTGAFIVAFNGRVQDRPDFDVFGTVLTFPQPLPGVGNAELLPTGATAAIGTFGGLLGLGALVALVLLCLKRWRSKPQIPQHTPAPKQDLAPTQDSENRARKDSPTPSNSDSIVSVDEGTVTVTS